MQPLQQLPDWQLRREAGDEVDEVLALETHRPIAVPGGEAHARKLPLELARRHREVTLRLDVAAAGDVDLRHGSSGSETRRGRGREVRATALDDDTDIARISDRARLVERDAHPLEPELLEQQQGEAMRQGLDQLELRSFDVGEDALGHLLVVHRIRHIVTEGRAPAVHRQLDVEDDGLLDPPLPFYEADDALSREAAQEDAIAGRNGAGHKCGIAASAA